MWQTTIMAWRNIWRNTRRTITASAAIGLGLTMILVTWSLLGGMFGHMIRSATSSYLGHAQVHATDYKETLDPELVIHHAGDVLKEVRALDHVTEATPRAIGQGLLAIGDRSAGVQILGVELDTEPNVTDWDERIVEGRYPAASGETLIGKALADRLEVGVGDFLVLTTSDIFTGDLARLRLDVVGVTFTNNPLVDKQMVIIPIEDAQGALGLDGDFHEIAVLLDGEVRDEAVVAQEIAPLNDLDGIEAEPWHAFSPGVDQLLKLETMYLWIYVGLTFFVISLGIVNTLLMSLLERTHEFGILRAVGTPGSRLAYMIFAEAASLGVVGVALGLLCYAPIQLLLGGVGLNMGTVEMAGVSFNARIYPVFDPETTVLLIPVFIGLTTITALTTAIRATRIEPVEALRHV